MAIKDFYTDNNDGLRRLIRPIAAVVLIAIVIILIIIFAVSGHKDNDKKPTLNPTVSKGMSMPKSGMTDSKLKDSTSKSSDSSKPSTTTTSTTDSTATVGIPANGQLTNTGPGDTLAIAAATMLIGAVAYQIALRRRA